MTATTTGQTDWERFRSRVQAQILATVPEHLQRLRWNRAQIEATQTQALRRLLEHAKERSPFHRGRLGDVRPENVGLDDLRRLPVMTKSEMMRALDDVFTDERLNRERVEKALAVTGREPVPIFGEYVTLASGGSSGERGVFVYDAAAMVQVMCALSRPLLARLDALGGPPPGGLPITLVAADSAVHATGATPAFATGDGMPFRFTSVPVTKPLAEIVQRLNELQPPVLYGYPSILLRLAAEKVAGRLSITPVAIGSTSEMLLPEAREQITEAFGVPVADTFGSSEGLFGAAPPGESAHVFATDLCIVELVDDDNRPVEPGQPSAKVLLTNLYNLTQPLIRYELTDCFVQQTDSAEHGLLRAEVEGRSDDVLRYDEAEVHPLVIRSTMVKTPEVLEYQVRQTSRGVDVGVVTDGQREVPGVADRLRQALAEVGMTDAEVTVRVVEALERHPQTGKFRRFIPLQ